MADFVQVMKDWKRMCKSMGQEDEYTACDKCKLRSFDCPAIYEEECDGADWNHVEDVVTKWAAEHPEPVYPTWCEWLANVGVLVCDTSYPNMRHWYAINKLKLDQPIPADIAEKLGIKPKENT